MIYLIYRQSVSIENVGPDSKEMASQIPRMGNDEDVVGPVSVWLAVVLSCRWLVEPWRNDYSTQD